MRGVIKGLLAEELKASRRMEAGYRKALKALPQGVLIRKVINGSKYYYLAMRKGDKVVYSYKGAVSAEELKKYADAKKKRAQYRKLLSKACKQVRYLKGALRGKEPV